VIERIDLELCDGCNLCVESCPTDVLKMMEVGNSWGEQTWKATIAYPNDCHNCRLCAIDCHVDAITVTHGITLPQPLFAYTKEVLNEDVTAKV